MSNAAKSTISRTEEILDVAQDLIQTKGYNGFSYRDIAAAIGIKSASIHYHFPTKGDLGQSVTARYRDRFSQALQTVLETTEGTRPRLESYAALFRNTLVECDRLCMCGMLAGEIETIPDIVKTEVSRFFEEQEHWLSHVIEQGITAKEIQPSTNPQTWAATLLASLEGAMLVFRGFNHSESFDIVVQNLLDTLFAPAK